MISHDDDLKRLSVLREDLALLLYTKEVVVQEITCIQKRLQAKCEHPQGSRQEYKWEHDNGYGQQTMMTGHQCKDCGLRNNWPNMSNIWS